MKTIFYNGTILDSLDFKAYEALAIDQGLIFMKGTLGDCKNALGVDAQLVNLEGATLFPGFSDSHMHLLGYGQSLFQVDLTASTSLESLVGIGQSFLEEHPLSQNEWLLGRGWNQDYFDFPIMPTREQLDLISATNPIFFTRACGHLGVANTLALKLSGIWDEPTQHVDGGHIDLNFDGVPTGILRENAMNLLLKLLPSPTEDSLRKYILKAQSELFSGGITSVQSDDLCSFPLEDSSKILNTFKTMGSEGSLKLSVHEQALMRNLDHFKIQIEGGYSYKKTFGNFSFGPLKILGDGSLGARTAYLREPYSDAPEMQGIPMYSPEELDALVETSFNHGIPVAIHGIGDGMIDRALNAIEKALDNNPTPPERNAIVHCQITDYNMLARMQEMKVIAMIQPIFLDYDLHMVEDRVGKERAKTTYAFNTMERMGIHTAYGTDCPVEGYHVFKGIQCAVTRQDLHHIPEEGWLPEEAVTVEEALRAYTLGSAYAEGEENHKGCLGVGMIADLVILDQNPLMVKPQELSQIKILATYKNGELVYSWNS